MAAGLDRAAELAESHVGGDRKKSWQRPCSPAVPEPPEGSCSMALMSLRGQAPATLGASGGPTRPGPHPLP